ncbi:acetyl-CoA carboxylase, carboxyltransferase subunit beta [Jeotgalibaca caeni]|uniref:acetyl-CoA carboxylase, carboxyltransferase subunit beta n=1 Tax=Jeotgalibaca caeni TaxID=3028623 RepID=UPI00237EC4F2|nr:acetyl-CoA carboxylase, carboxyltransferase subunit beta [Jeotgalibaca caeni]MDE1547870.1 acetyl-CoA carboxylase, carboxyltransferase subunit beta [Jeotgalibaca caeni]
MKLFRKRPYIPLQPSYQNDEEVQKPVVPEGLWEKCPNCSKTIYSKDLGDEKICPHCQYNFRISAHERIAMIVDKDTFEEWNSAMPIENPLAFPGYEQKLARTKLSAGIDEAVVTGKALIQGAETVLCVMDSNFFMGSMGKIVGEKLTRAFEQALAEQLPVIVFTASGGARMQEGILSLMQMAKVSAAVANHQAAGLLYITVLTDPTTGGVTASFAMQGDIILAEPGATIGFAGKRVIEQTIKASVPEGFQTAEHLLEKGFIDRIVPRKQLRFVLGHLLAIHMDCTVMEESGT